MSLPPITGRTGVAGVIGSPIRHSLSPLLHNAWLAAAGIDGVYVPFEVAGDRFEAFVDAHRGGRLLGVNVTSPFKERALASADRTNPAAVAAGAANLLVFGADGSVEAMNTDGLGLLGAFAEQAPDWRASDRPVVVMGAGGAARGAIAVLCEARACVRIVNRTAERAYTLKRRFEAVQVFEWTEIDDAFAGAGTLINATSAGLETTKRVDLPLTALAADAVVMDMFYAPVETPLLQAAHGVGLRTVDGLAMLISQARPTFETLFGCEVPAAPEVRALAIQALAGTIA